MKHFRVTVRTPAGSQCYRAIARRKLDVILGAIDLFEDAENIDARQI